METEGEPQSFSDLGLHRPLCTALTEAGYSEPTPIQAKAIPQVLRGLDLLGCARTGTGKTAAFALPLLQLMLDGGPREDSRATRRKEIRTLVLAPTRELAAQIGASFERYSGRAALRHLVVFGGVGKQPQVRALRRGVDVLVATPGRLLDLCNDGEIDLGHVEHFVLDEADRMLDMGFIHDVRRITAKLPDERQNLMFSATMPKEIQHLARKILVDPVKVAVDPIASTALPVSQVLYALEHGEKPDLLIHLLADPEMRAVLVFTRTKHGADRLVRKLSKADIAAAAIHGNKSQTARERALQGIKDGVLQVLVATDIAARGIDVKDLSHVVNFDLPNIPESYVHRIGRTGRAGAEGVAIAFCAGDEWPHLAAIEKLTKVRVTRMRLPIFEKQPRGPRHGENNGGRGSAGPVNPRSGRPGSTRSGGNAGGKRAPQRTSKGRPRGARRGRGR